MYRVHNLIGYCYRLPVTSIWAAILTEFSNDPRLFYPLKWINEIFKMIDLAITERSVSWQKVI